MNNNLREKLVIPAVVGAMYAALTVLLAPISYGPVQFRVSEALCVLPLFFPYTAVGLFIGCLIANLLSPVGVLDIVFGSLATLGAVQCVAALGAPSRKTGLRPEIGAQLLACLMPVVWNGVIIGAMLAWVYARSAFWSSFFVMGLEVALGELGVMLLVGLPLIAVLPRLQKALSAKD